MVREHDGVDCSDFGRGMGRVHVFTKHPGDSDSPSLPHGEVHPGIIWILKIEGDPRIFTAGTDFSKPRMTHSGKVREQKGTPEET